MKQKNNQLQRYDVFLDTTNFSADLFENLRKKHA